MLNGDTTAQRPHAFEVSVGNCFAMVEEPVQSFERHVAIHFFEDIQESCDALVIRRVEAEWPFVCRQ